MEEGAKFHPKTREEASLKSKLNPRTTSRKNEEQTFNDGEIDMGECLTGGDRQGER